MTRASFAKHQAAVPQFGWRSFSRLAVPFLSLLGVLALLVVTVPPTQAAMGDYSVSITAPETALLSEGVTYTVTTVAEATTINPAAGVVLTSVLSEGLTFDPTSVETGSSSPVQSVSYDEGTRTVTFVMKPLAQPITSFSFATLAVDNTTKSDATVLTTTIRGSASTNGVSPPDDSAATKVTGNYDYSPIKYASSLINSDNRLVTYTFNVRTEISHGGVNTFSTTAQRIMDTLPAGSQLVATSSGFGTWTTDIATGATASSDWTATWQHDGNYGPDRFLLAPINTIWLQVRYPDTAEFPEGSRPPVNTAELFTLPVDGIATDPLAWRQHTIEASRYASDQGPQFGTVDAPVFGLLKVSGQDTSSAGDLYREYSTIASFADGGTGEQLASWTIEDSASKHGNAEFWGHMEVRRVAVEPNPALEAANVPYTVEYRTAPVSNPVGESAWKTVGQGLSGSGTPQTFNSGSGNVEVLFNVDGSLYYDDPGWVIETIPVGTVITGWRVQLGSTSATVSSGSQASIRTSYIPTYTSFVDGSTSAEPLTNIATANGILANGIAVDTIESAMKQTFIDSAYVVTNIWAPPSLRVNGSGEYIAGISNMNTNTTYHGGTLSVVLPYGVLYDADTGVTRHNDTVSVTGDPVPNIGSGATVTTSWVPGPFGDQQVVTITVDELPSMRPVGEASNRWIEHGGFQYVIPVVAIVDAYREDDTVVEVESWAFANDPAHAGAPAIGYAPKFSADVHDFDPNRTSIAKAVANSQITIAGDLIISKTSGATNDPAGHWGLGTTVPVGTAAYWKIAVQNILPDAVTSAVFFDRLPHVADSRGSEFNTTLAGPIQGLPPGATAQYSKDATTASNGTWSNDPTDAVAFKILLGKLAESESFEVIVPTSVPRGTADGAIITNDVSATANYHGDIIPFHSNEAQINAVDASITLAKTGTLVGSLTENPLVRWTFTVTNTGVHQLSSLEIIDSLPGIGPIAWGTWPGAADALDPGESVTATADSLLTEAQIADGTLRNTATAAGTTADGIRVVSEEATAVVSWKSTLTLVKQVSFGSASPTDWTLSASGVAGALAGPSGTTGSPEASASVTPGTTYSLSEQGSQNTYQQVGAWACADSLGNTVAVASGVVTIPMQRDVTCTVTNATAQLILLKHVADAKLDPADWQIVATPRANAVGLPTVAAIGAEHNALTNTFEVLPGHPYDLTEESIHPSGTIAYRMLSLERQNPDGSWSQVDPGQPAVVSVGTTEVYRFVNDTIPSVTLPLTGGASVDAFLIAGAGILASAITAALVYQRRRRMPRS
ncbi:DUF7507 domain-containing protein [Lysinibacter cavernae]|uniref:LPXTG-motif cell wall-anchored protein n=1 Tax=Lysinibacter cavernae TaxID=1640652 RepID=A0A7X5R1C1_9MICO|nr:LPXTG cell wall anchor domain-containing protein [Lysinibacter cavernae]NIH53682.1 LPXTG-motif cell wall-anchored protein [Lysinibacter cavernae]